MPYVSNMKPTTPVSIDLHELNRLRECERAWNACFEALQAFNPEAFQRPMPGLECAVAEIQRLQAKAWRYSAPRTRTET